jgi:hypothetical protein
VRDKHRLKAGNVDPIARMLFNLKASGGEPHGKRMDWLNFGEGVAAGGGIELIAAIGIFLATRYITPTGPRTLTMSRGHHRAFIRRATNHRERWLWRVIDVPFHRLVASGEEGSEQLAVNTALTLMNRLARGTKGSAR